jgi:Zn-dependent protease
MGGPIAVTAGPTSGEMVEFFGVLFLAALGVWSALLAVVNLLPLPGCDAFAMLRALLRR